MALHDPRTWFKAIVASLPYASNVCATQEIQTATRGLQMHAIAALQ